MVLGTGDKRFHHQGNVGTIGNTHRNKKPYSTIGKGPIGHLIGDQIRVGNDHICLVEGLDGCGPKANPFDFGPLPTDFDRVTHPDGSFKEQNEAADKIVHNTLQTKADADAKGTQHDGEFCDIEPECRDG